jgi:hypothetical protein
MLGIVLRAVIQSLEAERIEANCAWKRCNWEKRRMEILLRSSAKTTMSLEAEFTEANHAWQRSSRKKKESRNRPQMCYIKDHIPEGGIGI